MISKLIAATVLVAASLGTFSARAATTAPFTEPAFAASQAEGKPILVHVTAPWCPTCKQQHPILSQLEQGAAYKDLVVYDVDFDSQKDVLRKMKVTMQSTLIAYHGAKEKARSTGDTDPAKIATLLAQVNQ